MKPTLAQKVEKQLHTLWPHQVSTQLRAVPNGHQLHISIKKRTLILTRVEEELPGILDVIQTLLEED